MRRLLGHIATSGNASHENSDRHATLQDNAECGGATERPNVAASRSGQDQSGHSSREGSTRYRHRGSSGRCSSGSGGRRPDRRRGLADCGLDQIQCVTHEPYQARGSGIRGSRRQHHSNGFVGRGGRYSGSFGWFRGIAERCWHPTLAISSHRFGVLFFRHIRRPPSEVSCQDVLLKGPRDAGEGVMRVVQR